MTEEVQDEYASGDIELKAGMDAAFEGQIVQAKLDRACLGAFTNQMAVEPQFDSSLNIARRTEREAEHKAYQARHEREQALDAALKTSIGYRSAAEVLQVADMYAAYLRGDEPHKPAAQGG